MTDACLFQRAVIIGLGLIGGSLAAAMKQQGLAKTIVGSSLRQDHIDIALHLDLIHEGTTHLDEALKGADLIVIATPLLAFEPIFKTLGSLPEGWLADNVIVTDVGSVKTNTIAWAKDSIPHLLYVPGHPIAGSEKSGITAADPYLFKAHLVVICTHKGIETQAVKASWVSILL